MKNKSLVYSYFISFIIFFLYSYSFFRSPIISTIISSILSLKFKDLFLDFFEKKDLIQKREMFKNFLDVLNSSISSGKNFYQSILDCEQEIKSYYGKNELITREISKMISNIDNGYSVEEALELFKKELDFEEADTFVDSLKLAMSTGVDIKEIILNSKLHLNDQIEVENEISISLNKSKREFIIMIILPILILFLLYRTNFKNLTLVDYIVRAIVFVVITFSIHIGQKIVNLEI